MPGFDKNRFVDLRSEEEDEFSCGICHDILAKPVVVPCCRQIYCEDCINEWLNVHQTCPNDRSLLNKNGLTQPPIIVQNLLAKLKIRCDYEKDGCDHVSQLENLTTHLTKYCSFNPDRKCRDCGALKDENIEHNCIQNLFAMVKSSSESIRDVQTELACVKESIEVFGQTQQIYDFEYVNNTQELSSLRSEIDKLKRDKEDYKMNENMHLIKIESLSDEFSKLMSEVEVLKEEIKVLRFQIQVHYRSISNINLIFSGTQEILNFFELRLKYFEI
jgi:hypothetical protein